MNPRSFLTKLRHRLLGKPLATAQISHERLTNVQGLAIFGADALSSTAYATEEILLVLVAAGGAIRSVASLITALAISALIFLVAVSYRQVIHAYPQGGGVYNVARKNLGEYPALIGAASLLIDYALTAAVSVAAGVAALTSAFPILIQNKVALGILILLLLMWANLRGVRESGKIFFIPTYVFLGSFALLIFYGLFRFATGTFPVIATGTAGVESLGAIGILLALHMFAAGCTAMTGIEAISNGVQAFKTPESRNAAKTMMRMAFLLGSIFLGITLLAYLAQAVPTADETVVSQIAHALFNGGPFYYLIQLATALILLLAANTPFAGFPRVASQLAQDGYFPRQFFNLGSRLVFATGIITLAVCAGFLIYAFGGAVHALIPLYAVGVFLGFSLSQLGMIMHWKKLGGRAHGRNITVNIIGLAATALVFIIVFFAKFTHGAWLLIPAEILLVMAMKKIKNHYAEAEKLMALTDHIPEMAANKTMIILVSRLSRATIHAIKFAQSFQPARLRAVHVAIDPRAAKELREKWPEYVKDVPLDVLSSEYRDLIGPLLQYVSDMEKLWKGDSLIVVIPQFVPQKFWENFLYNKTAQRLGAEIEKDPNNHAQILEVPIKPTQFH